MTLPELKNLLKEELKLPLAYRCFAPAQVPTLPYIVYYADEDINFYADDTVYAEGCAVTIEVYSEQKDLELEGKVKEILKSKEIPYKSYEAFLDSEDMYLKAFEITLNP